MPKRGDIAICGRGQVGMITCDRPRNVSYDNGRTSREVWFGIHLGRGREGDAWQSVSPEVVGHISDAVKSHAELISQIS